MTCYEVLNTAQTELRGDGESPAIYFNSPLDGTRNYSDAGRYGSTYMHQIPGSGQPTSLASDRISGRHRSSYQRYSHLHRLRICPLGTVAPRRRDERSTWSD